MILIKRLVQKFIWAILPSGPLGDRARGVSYHFLLSQAGSNFKMGEHSFIYSPEKLIVGNNVYIGFSSYLGNGSIYLEDEVLIGNHVSITPANHISKNGSYRFGGSELNEIRIGFGTWIGAHSCIVAGVTIGSNCLVAAGSVVTKNFGDNKIIGGVPAKVLVDNINE